jgi:xylulokinase
VRVPDAQELTALGAAAQAAGLLLGEDPAAVARRWGTARGRTYEGPARRDDAALGRIGEVLADAGGLLHG